MGRIASIDYGLKRIGIAISDERGIIASSLTTVHAGKNLKETINQIVLLLKPLGVEKIIVGHPILLNGKEGLLANLVKEFVSFLKKEFFCDIELVDERLSTAQAERLLKDHSVNRKKRAGVIDTLSATILLQSYLTLHSKT